LNSLEQLNLFLAKYNRSKSLNFSKIEVFSKTKILQPFGICLEDNKINFSSRTCFGKNRTFYYDTYSPFNFEEVEYLEDLNLIILHSNFGFSFRIYNVVYESITPEFWKSFDNRTLLKMNTKICKSGEVKYYSPFKGYVEIYSEKHSVLSAILGLRYETSYLEEYDINMILSFFDIYCIDHREGINRLNEIKEKESIALMNPFLCIKKDKLLDKELIFYSFNALF